MNNFWHWSGGFCQYLAWAGKGPMPYPPPSPGGSWDVYQKTAAQFYSNDEAVRDLRRSAEAHRAAAGVEPDGDLGAGQRAARDQQRQAVRHLDRRDGAPDPFDGAGPAGHHRQRGADRVAVVRRASTPCAITRARSSTSSRSTSGSRTGAGSARRTSRAATPRRWSWRKSTSTTTPSRAAKLGKPLLLEEFGFPRDGHSFAADSAGDVARQVLRRGLRAGQRR